jgi:hypothetical protein
MLRLIGVVRRRMLDKAPKLPLATSKPKAIKAGVSDKRAP